VRKLIVLFSVLLAVQIGLVAWVHRTDDELATFSASRPFLEVDAADVDQVVIEGGAEGPLVMKREQGQWVLPGKGGFPVSSKKLDSFFEKLLTAKASWPVGRTRVAAKQLEVAENAFERKIRLFRDGEVLEELYIGSSPGFRKVHARLGDAPDTHVIDFNAFDAPTNPADWYERDLLQLSSAELARVDLGAFALKRREQGFELEGLTEDEQPESDKVDEVVKVVTNVSFLDELGANGPEIFENSELILEYTVTQKDGKTVKYTVVGPSEADHYVLKASTYPYYFKVAKKKFDDLRALDRGQLVLAAPETVESRTSTVERRTSNVESQPSNVVSSESELESDVEDQESAAGAR